MRILLVVASMLWAMGPVPIMAEEQDSPITVRAYDHLLELIVDAEGNPNPRLTCSAGYQHAADYAARQMEAIGLVPIGNLERTSYYQTIVGSVHEEYCPPGLSSVVGMVEGTEHPDHFIVSAAHLDCHW